jgi:hypothetical protein
MYTHIYTIDLHYLVVSQRGSAHKQDGLDGEDTEMLLH